MASARIDTKLPEYDSTRWRLVPALTGMPQDSGLHECPVYVELNHERGWAFAMHGPQCPRAVGVEAGKRLAPAGINPVTGRPRLPFGLREDGLEYAKPIPFVHGFVLEWRIPGETLNGGPAFGHIEGGVFIHQVAKSAVWYLKTWFAQTMLGSKGIYRSSAIEVTGKVIFIQRPVVDLGGVPAISASCSSWLDPETRKLLIPGAPSSVTVKYRGHPDYPTFSNVVMRIDDAQFNPARFAQFAGVLNREGMFTEPVAGITDPSQAAIADDWDQHDLGDGLAVADLSAGIQHGHKG